MDQTSDNPPPANMIVRPEEGLVVSRLINGSGILAALLGVALPLGNGIVDGWGFQRSALYTAVGLIYLGIILGYLSSARLAAAAYRYNHLYLFVCGLASFGLVLISADPYLQPLVFTVPFVIAVISVSPRMAAILGGSYVCASALALVIVGTPQVEIAISAAVYAPIFLFMFGMVRLAVDQTLAHREAARLAAENARLAAENATIATLAERNRIARELHDTIAQGLTALTMQLEAAQRALTRDPERAALRLGRAHELARETLADVRRSVWALADQQLDGQGLVAALRTLAAETEARSGIVVQFHQSGSAPNLRSEQSAQVLRIVQEALANVQRHAQAQVAQIELTTTEAGVVVSVSDDGVGFEPHLAQPRSDGGGFGLIGLRERAALAGGTLRIDSTLGNGTTVRLVIPSS